MTISGYDMHRGDLHMINLILIYVEYEVSSINDATDKIYELVRNAKVTKTEIGDNELSDGSKLYNFSIGNYNIMYTYNDNDGTTHSYSITTHDMDVEDEYYYDKYIFLEERDIYHLLDTMINIYHISIEGANIETSTEVDSFNMKNHI